MAIKFRERCIFSQNYLEEMLKKERNEFLKRYENELSEDLIDEDQLEYVDDDDENDDENDEELGDVEVEVTEDDFMYENDDAICEEVETLEDEEEDVEEHEDLSVAGNGKRQMEIVEDSSMPKKRLRNFFICEECGEYFKLEVEYNAHMEGHFERKSSKQYFPCELCRGSFPSKNQLHNHQREEHGGNRLFKCATCGEQFLEHSAKQRHEM